jgi:hypothetical protein
MPDINNQISKKKILIIIVICISIIVALLFIFLRKQKKNEYEFLASKIPVEQGIQIPTQNDGGDNLLLLDEKIKIYGISTGEVYGYRMKDANTSEHIADASVLNIITKDDEGNAKTLGIILQIFPINDRDTNIFQGPLKTLSSINSTSLPSKVTNKELAELLPKGSGWTLIPLIDPFLRFSLDNPEAYYAVYSKKYYGEDVALIKEFIESGLTKDYDKPLLILGIGRLTQGNTGGDYK